MAGLSGDIRIGARGMHPLVRAQHIENHFLARQRIALSGRPQIRPGLLVVAFDHAAGIQR